MYLVDANVWLERLLDQERSAEDNAPKTTSVARFLDARAYFPILSRNGQIVQLLNRRLHSHLLCDAHGFIIQGGLYLMDVSLN